MFGVLYLLDHHCETEGDQDAAYGWVLVDASSEEGRPVPGRAEPFDGLFEELLTSDPLGVEGRDFLT